MQVFVTRIHERAVRKMLGEDARRDIEQSIMPAPDATSGSNLVRGERIGPLPEWRWPGSSTRKGQAPFKAPGYGLSALSVTDVFKGR